MSCGYDRPDVTGTGLLGLVPVHYLGADGPVVFVYYVAGHLLKWSPSQASSENTLLYSALRSLLVLLLTC